VPKWVWALLVVFSALLAGRIATDAGSGKQAAAKAKKLQGSAASGSSKGSSSGVSTARFLELTLRLQEMTQIATALTSLDESDAMAVKELDAELFRVEDELVGDESSIARDLRSMVAVVRGTLMQHTAKLSDEEVESLEGNAFTYANPRYWEDYYSKTSAEEKYDWYGTWDSKVEAAGETLRLKDLLTPKLAKSSKILMFGCGNSDMSEKMYEDGYESIVNIDISENVINFLKERLQERMPNMRWMAMNVSDLTFADSDFDIVLDKGTLDAIEGSPKLLRAAVFEASRTLRPGGLFLSITFNDADARIGRQLKEAANWQDCSTETFERTSSGTAGSNRFFVHSCRKP